VNRCAYANVEADGDTFNLTGDYNNGVQSIVGRYTFTQFGAECLRAMREGKPFLVEDSETDPRVQTVVESYRLTQIRSVIGVPLLKAGRFVAAMAVHQTRPRKWQAEEAELLQLVANRCWESIERTRVERAMEQQWRTFDIALSHTPDFTYTFNLEGQFTYINRALLSLWGKSYEEAVGKDFFELEYPPELAARLQSQIQQVIATKGPVRDHTPFTGPAGETRHYEYIFVPVFGTGGEVQAVAGSTRDVTEHKKGEELVDEDRRRWRELLTQTPAAIAVLRGPDLRFEWANADYLLMVGRSAEALIGKTARQALPEIESQVYFTLLEGVYKTGEPYTGREALIRFERDGALQDLYVNFVYAATRDVAGEIDGIFVHVTDVSDMVLARKQIEESERQFRTLAESIPHLAWMADSTGYIFWYNRRWYDYTGTRFENVEGWGWQSVVDPKVLPDVLVRWKGSVETGEPLDIIFPLRGADGALRPFLTRVEPVRDSQGSVVRWFGTNTDITLQRRTEEELRKTNRELEEFSYVASHDLQEPLRMVSIYTQLILSHVGDNDPRLRQHGEFVEQGVARMEALIRDLLTYSRTIHKEEELTVGSGDLSAALAEAVLVLQSAIDDSCAVITAPPLPLVRGDTGQLAHVFQNLISNGLKYRSRDTPPEIRIGVAADDNDWIVSVQDNGIGFEPQYAQRIFGLFKRLHKEEYPGTGLGLAICQRIVERYGGRMWAEGRPGEGATFYFALPGAGVY
jgi:PAS domain S-box-containing protein